jgi:myosin heavy subunit
VIEFALLFGLGFLSATLIAMLLAPAIHRRIVRYAENRIKATMPISPQEVRAQRDMARAVYAAENARTKQELAQERTRSTSFQLRLDALNEEARHLEAYKAELQMRIDQFDVEAADARARLRESDSYIQELKAALLKAEEAEAETEREQDELRQQLIRLTSDADNVRTDLSSRDTELENLRLRITTLRDERENLRNELREQTTRAKDAESRLTQEEERVARLEDRLNREIADRSDKEEALERRLQEIARLRDKLAGRSSADATVEADTVDPGVQPLVTESAAPAEPTESSDPADTDTDTDIDTDVELADRILAVAEEARHRATALSERLLNGKNTANDEALRQEMAAIAASMVAVTAAGEGKASPIHAILSGRTGTGGRESLAARAKKSLTSITRSPG